MKPTYLGDGGQGHRWGVLRIRRGPAACHTDLLPIWIGSQPFRIDGVEGLPEAQLWLISILCFDGFQWLLSPKWTEPSCLLIFFRVRLWQRTSVIVVLPVIIYFEVIVSYCLHSCSDSSGTKDRFSFGLFAALTLRLVRKLGHKEDPFIL